MKAFDKAKEIVDSIDFDELIKKSSYKDHFEMLSVIMEESCKLIDDASCDKEMTRVCNIFIDFMEKWNLAMLKREPEITGEDHVRLFEGMLTSRGRLKPLFAERNISFISHTQHQIRLRAYHVQWRE